MTPDGAFLYAIKADSGPASSGSLQGYAVSGSTLTQLSPTHTLPAAQIATAIAISPDGLSLYVAAADTWNGTDGFLQRYAIDPQTGALSGPTLEASGFTASVFNLALSPDGLSLYAPSPSAGVVYQFDVTPSTGALAPKAAPTVPAGTGPYSIAVTPNGKFAYANGLSAVSGFAIDATTGALAPIGAAVPTQYLGRGSAVSPDSRNLYVTAYPAHHFTIDPGTGLLTAQGSSPCCRLHVGLAFTPDQGPVASFAAVAAPEGLATTFDASASTDSDGTVATYLWDFHDGPKVTGGPTISHTFGSAGSHTVDLTVTDDMGCSNTRTYTGHMVHCNGTAAARQTKTVVITPVAPPWSSRPMSSTTPRRCRPPSRLRAPPPRRSRRPSTRCASAAVASDRRRARPSPSRSRRTRRCATRCCGATARRSGRPARDWGHGAHHVRQPLAVGHRARRRPERHDAGHRQYPPRADPDADAPGSPSRGAHPDRRPPPTHPRHAPAARDGHKRQRPVRRQAGQVLDHRARALTAVSEPPQT